MRRFPFPALLVAIVALSACSDDGTIVDEGGNDPVGPPATAQEFLDALDQAFTDRDTEGYDALLADDYVFYFAPEDVDVVGEIAWDRARDLASMTKMFSGQPGIDANLDILPPVTAIDVVMTITSPFTADFDDGPELAAADLRGGVHFEMDIDFGPELRASVRGEQHLYLEVSESTGGDPVVRLLAWRDLGLPVGNVPLARSSEASTVGRIKSLF